VSLRSLFVLSSALIVVSASAVAQCNTNDSTAPCFSNVYDVLGGRQSVIQDDDLVVTNVASQVATDFSQYSTSLTQNSQVQSSTNVFPRELFPGVANPVVIRARLANTPNDQVVFARGNTMPAPPRQSVDVSGMGTVTPPALNVLNGLQSLYGVSGHFLGNGFDQVVLAASQLNSTVQQIAFQVIAASNPNDPTQGIVAGPMSTPITNASTVYAMTSGVFTSPSGSAAPQSQIALVSGNPQNGQGLTVSLYNVTSSMGITPGQVFNLNLGAANSAKIFTVAIAAGRFSGGDHDQIAVAYLVSANAIQNTQVVILDFGTSSGIQKASFQANGGTVGGTAYPGAVYLQAARFNWFSSSAQLAIATDEGVASGNNGNHFLQVVSFNASLTPTLGTQVGALFNACHFGLAAGRFDRYQPAPNQTQPNPNLQLADISTNCSRTSATTLNLYDVNPTTFAITNRSSASIFTPNQYGPSKQINSNLVVSMTAADTQGRSLYLQPAEKATVTGHIQPDTILGVPPMHVDFVPPAGQTVPQVVNVSVFPSSFNTAYTFQKGQTGSVNRTGSTSYTAATKETVGGKISYGIPGVGKVSVQNSEAFGQMHQNVVAKAYNTYHGQSSDFSAITKFDDLVTASSIQMNIFSYRVVGQCVADTNAPGIEGCAAGTKPLYVQFTGPDNVQYVQAAEGRNLEWYQPVQEPGNIFSYPGNMTQLENTLEGGTGFEPLTATNTFWDSQATTASTANWNNESNNSVTSGSVSSHSFDSQTSASASASIFGFDVSASTSFGYNESKSTSTVNQSTSSVSESQGITLNHGISGSTVNIAAYDYAGQSVIYGQTPPTGTLQTNLAVPGTVQAKGHLAAAHVADMLFNQGSNFWPQTYATPDLALNHPQRWIQKEPSGVNEQEVQFNCPIGFSSTLTSPSCTPVAQVPNPTNVADASFYLMKGLFVTPGDTMDGPTITNTVLGSTVNLRARVYNYSLANFPAGTTIHVQFYAQPWGVGSFSSQPGNPSQFADAIFIGEGTNVLGDALTPPPAFCGGASDSDPCTSTSAPANWEYAYTTWDTSKNGVTANSTWKFWVVTWAESGGKLFTELSGHGLTSLPSTPFQSIASVPVETYSNNLGYYNQVFTVLGPATLGAQKGTAVLTLENIHTRNGVRVRRDAPVTIEATHRSTGRDIQSVLTFYYDGNPDRGGTLFDIQAIDRIPGGKTFVDTARFTPSTCGVHRIFVRTIPQDGSVKQTTAEQDIHVTLDAALSVYDLEVYVNKLTLPFDVRRHLIDVLSQARRSFAEGRNGEGLALLRCFQDEIRQRGFPPVALSRIHAHIEDIRGCVN
jgi:hypothetical protein